MVKRLFKLLIVLLMVIGVAITASNMMEKDLHAAPGKWVDYHPDEPDCYGDGSECYDMTSPQAVSE